MVTPSPLAHSAVGAAQVATDLHIGRGVGIGGPQDDAGAQRQRLRRALGSCQSLQITAGVLRYNDAGSKGRWHGYSPCQKAVEIHHTDLLPLSYSLRDHKQLQLVTDLR